MKRIVLALFLGGTIACSGDRAASTPSGPSVPQGGLGIRGRASPFTAVGSGEWARGTSAAPGTAVVMGSIDKEAIRKTILDHAPEVRDCYEERLAADPRLEGKITVKWVVGPDGRASSPQVDGAQTTLASEDVARCVMERIVTWQFPRPVGGGIAVIAYPWVLRSAAGSPVSRGRGSLTESNRECELE